MLTSLQEDPTYHVLYSGNVQFRKLCDEYLDIKRQTSKMNKKSGILSESESEKLHQLKLRKLAVKDQIFAMMEET